MWGIEGTNDPTRRRRKRGIAAWDQTSLEKDINLREEKKTTRGARGPSFGCQGARVGLGHKGYWVNPFGEGEEKDAQSVKGSKGGITTLQ